jgi:hypothetical protein
MDKCGKCGVVLTKDNDTENFYAVMSDGVNVVLLCDECGGAQ